MVDAGETCANAKQQKKSVEQTVSFSKVIPLLNAILHELHKHVVDDDETQVQETQDSSVTIPEDCNQVVLGLIHSTETR